MDNGKQVDLVFSRIPALFEIFSASGSARVYLWLIVLFVLGALCGEFLVLPADAEAV